MTTNCNTIELQTTKNAEIHHSFIADESQVREFYRQHILPFQDQNYLNFIIIPIARRKYWAPLSKSQMNMSTKVFSSIDDEDRFVNELRRYEVKCGLYKDTFTKPVGGQKDQDIPSEAMAFYLTANPMNELKAFFLMQREVSEKLEGLVMAKNDAARQQNQIHHIHSIFKSCLHRCDQKVFLKLDVDTKEEAKIESLKTFFKTHAMKPHLVIESRGGYHVLLKRSEIGKNHEKLHHFIEAAKKTPSNDQVDSTDKKDKGKDKEKGKEKKEEKEEEEETWITVEKNALVIIPGTLQGGFLARIVNFD